MGQQYINSEQLEDIFDIRRKMFERQLDEVIERQQRIVRPRERSSLIIDAEKLGYNKPICAICGVPVEKFGISQDHTRQIMIMTAHCHGEIQEVEIPEFVVEKMKPETLRIGLAFRPEDEA